MIYWSCNSMSHPVGIHRLAEFGETIFATMSAHTQQHGAINLGQGFPRL
ncbi:aminotransferase [Corynebacterium diphtheriae]|nr:aminotransferase [Corynebacterium diphtheriae]OWM41256.1 aminotransferase [Corynebacterium diphtheriae]OWM59423.1 aminotransferase [Corynebacterium diphtheriae]UJL60090.1 aminotransferase [Corynebacterium diphtheriae]UJL62286.1 aminotransferase [Corynebacterium diphtheriae]